MSYDLSIQHIQQTLANTAETVKSKLQERDVQKMIAKGVLATIGAVAFAILTAGFGVPALAVIFGTIVVFGGDFALLSMLEKNDQPKDEPLAIPPQVVPPANLPPVVQNNVGVNGNEESAPADLPPVVQNVEDNGNKEHAPAPVQEPAPADLSLSVQNVEDNSSKDQAPPKKISYFERMNEPSTLSNDSFDSNLALYVEDTASKPVEQQSGLSIKLLKGAAVASFVALGSYALSSVPGVVATAIDTLPYLPIM